jgi:hypothetical protein
MHSTRKSQQNPTYSVEAIFHYTYQGRVYTSSRYHIDTASSSGRAAKQRIVDQIPPGTHTTCYVNPSNPAEAVIYRGLSPVVAFGFMGLVFLLIGGSGFYFAPKLSGATPQHHAVPQPAPSTGEPIPLKPQVSPLGQFLFLFGFALVWDGIVGVFIYLGFFSANHSASPFFARVFTVVFGFVGLLVLAAAIRGFLALFNPRLHLTARSTSVPLSGVFQFEWTLTGRAERLHKIRIVLEGREESTYQSGRNSQTARQVFAEIPVIETGERDLIAQGQGRVTIPAGLMHTFHGRSNKIVWILRVHGEIPHWPGIDEDFPVIVLPQSATT